MLGACVLICNATYRGTLLQVDPTLALLFPLLHRKQWLCLLDRQVLIHPPLILTLQTMSICPLSRLTGLIEASRQASKSRPSGLMFSDTKRSK